MILAAFHTLVVVLGILSMGFQLLASRLLSPYFGSGLNVWAWLISTFLAAFSIGSILGGWISNFPAPRRTRTLVIVAVTGLVALLVTARWARPILNRIELATYDSGQTNLGLFLACTGLFFFPTAAVSIFGPQNVQYLASRGTAPGVASGVVYGISTFGNIAGVMLTSLVLIPNFRVSTLVHTWLVVAACSLTCLIVILHSGKTRLPS